MSTSSIFLAVRARIRLAGLLACWGILGHLGIAGLVGLPLMAVAPSANASCTYNGTTQATYTYTAANIGSAAALPFSGSWTCSQNNNVSSSSHICYMTQSTNTVTRSAGGTMTFSSSLTDGQNSPSSMTSGSWYGLYSTPGTTVNTTFTVTVPAGQATGKTPGTYTNTSVKFYLDEQANSGSCEGSTSSWDSGNTTLLPTFVVPGSCLLISTPTIDFGGISEIGTTSADISATGNIIVNCTNTTAYTVYLGDGNHRVSSGSGNRRMANGSALLPYQLYKGSNHSVIWSDTGLSNGTGGSGGVSGTGTGNNTSLTVYGLIAAGTVIPGTTGTYTDTVVVTVAY